MDMVAARLPSPCPPNGLPPFGKPPLPVEQPGPEACVWNGWVVCFRPCFNGCACDHPPSHPADGWGRELRSLVSLPLPDSF